MRDLLKKIKSVKLRIALALKIHKISKGLKLDKKGVGAHKKRWSRLSSFVNPKWFQAYAAISGSADIDYVPEDIFYCFIEPKMNNRDLALAYADKNSYERYYRMKSFPKVFIRNIHGLLLNDNYALIEECDVFSYLKESSKILIKPSIESSQGRNIEVFEKDYSGLFRNSAGECLTLEYLTRRYKSDYLIQEYVEQHHYFAQFNRTSLNGVRIFTYRSVSSNKVEILGAILKFGRKGCVVDNQNAGGICVAIRENGCLHEFATDMSGNRYGVLPDGRRFSQAGPVHRIAQMRELAVKIARENYHFRLLGLDMCVDKNDHPVVVEVNNNYLGLNFHQMSGKPLFGVFTDEVIDYCQRRT